MQFEKGKEYEGFELVYQEEISELKTLALIFKHKKTLAELLVLKNNDKNMYFGISFRTLADNEKGTAHILEHSVLNGSEKYPVKEPFNMLLRQSLATFINAFTGSTFTVYPFTTRNKKDLENLLNVYWDAVFHPRISENCFKQEGWHHELTDPDKDIVYKGVVYNEMKGSYSQIGRLAEHEIMKSLLPDSHYGIETGGIPETIPDLTYEEFLAFHKKYYHPSNSSMCLAGDVDIQEYLKLLNEEYLSGFDAQEIDNEVLLQKEFENFTKSVVGYPIAEQQSDKNATYVIQSYYLDDIHDRVTDLSFKILATILWGLDSSPIKRVLVESGLGEDIMVVDFDDNLKQCVFNIGLTGTEEEHAEDIVMLIQTKLSDLVENGIDENLVQAAINKHEFELIEESFDGYPKALIYHYISMKFWDFGENPINSIRFQKEFDVIKEKAAKGYFEELVKKYLLNNPRSNLLILKPDKTVAKRKEAELKEKLKKIKESMSDEDIKKMIKETNELIEMQNALDSKEDKDKMPVLPKSEVDKTGEEFPCIEVGDGLLHSDVDTSGIYYLKILGDLKDIPTQYYPYLALFIKCFRYLGTSRSSEDIEMDLLCNTGGINAEIFINQNLNNSEEVIKLVINGKSKFNQIDDLLRILKEIILDLNTDNKKKIKEIIDKEKHKLMIDILSYGHSYAANRVKAQYGELRLKNEYAFGISQYKFLEYLSKNFDEKTQEIMSIFKFFLQKILHSGNLQVHSTCKTSFFEEIKSKLVDFKDKIPFQEPEKFEYIDTPMMEINENEGLIIPSQVQYVLIGGKIDLQGIPRGVLNVLVKLLKSDYLWPNVRLKGGAYGAFGQYNDDSKILYLSSYRDPNVKETIEAYQGIVKYLEELDYDQEELDKLIVGTISEIDREFHPKLKGKIALENFLTNKTKEEIQQIREEVFACTPEDIKKLIPVFKDYLENAKLCVLGGETKIRDNEEIFGSVTGVFG